MYVSIVSDKPKVYYQENVQGIGEHKIHEKNIFFLNIQKSNDKLLLHIFVFHSRNIIFYQNQTFNLLSRGGFIYEHCTRSVLLELQHRMESRLKSLGFY